MKVYKEADGNTFCSDESYILYRISRLRNSYQESFKVKPDIIEMSKHEYDELQSQLETFPLLLSKLMESDKIFGMKIVVTS